MRILLMIGALSSGVLFLSGCGTSSLVEQLQATANISSGSGPSVPAQHLQPIDATVALVQLTGPSGVAASELTRQLDAAAQNSRLALMVGPNATGDVQLKGFLVAERRRNTVEVSFLWDVLDSQGQQLQRITGRELISGAVDHPDVWSAIPPSVYDAIAQKGISAVVAGTGPVGAPIATGSVPQNSDSRT